MEEIKCKYIYKKGIYKDQICNKINCKIHNKSHNKCDESKSGSAQQSGAVPRSGTSRVPPRLICEVPPLRLRVLA